MLGRAAESAPASPDIQFHFAQALADAGKKDEARTVLGTLLETRRPFDDRAQAQKLLQELGS
jgi:Tfp pilus assembly protein FimV